MLRQQLFYRFSNFFTMICRSFGSCTRKHRHILLWGDRMKQGNWKQCLKWIALTEAVGLLAGLLSREGTVLYQEYAVKPPLTPPGWVFGVVWTILYALMGISICRVLQAQNVVGGNRCLNLFFAQLIVNFFWPLLIFNAQAFGFALIWLALLWVLVLAMILCFYRVDPRAAWLQIPYLIWLTFAAYLNTGVWLLNT